MMWYRDNTFASNIDIMYIGSVFNFFMQIRRRPGSQNTMKGTARMIKRPRLHIHPGYNLQPMTDPFMVPNSK